MNYRHSFHAGNFADVVKHALLLRLLELRRATGPVAVVDTHAGSGLYDLSGDGARSREAEAGIARLMTADALPAVVAALADRVRTLNPDGGARLYPGSPWLVVGGMGPDDRYVGFEMNPPVLELLQAALAGAPHARALGGDGYDQALAAARATSGAVVLIDPPFERPDDYLRAADLAAAVVKADPAATVAVWTPLKDMETFDGFLRRLAGAGAPSPLVAEARLRPLTNPMKMNGCAMVFLNPPECLEAAAREVCGWVADHLGDAGARAEVWRA